MPCCSVLEAVTSALTSCELRGLEKTALWLGELLEYINPAMLEGKVDSPLEDSDSWRLSTPRNWCALKVALLKLRNQEYRRCHHDLTKFLSSSEGQCESQSKSALNFLAVYSLYLEGEREKNAMLSGALNEAGISKVTADATNPRLEKVKELLDSFLVELPEDSYLLWLRGVVLRQENILDEAITCFISALKSQPFLWCAAEDLAETVSSEKHLEESIKMLKNKFSEQQRVEWQVPWLIPTLCEVLGLLTFFKYEAAQALIQELVDESTASPAPLSRNPFVLDLQGRCFYGLKVLPVAKQIYSFLHEEHPYRLEGMDMFSSILYISTPNPDVLAKLAQDCFSIAPFSPEANVVVGNYYSALKKRDESIFYFRRAVQLNPKVLDNWTLLGHEYIETKNVSAAAECYRAALRINRNHYQSWYSLGLIYELQELDHFAVQYFWEAAALRPCDARMWEALASCLDQDGRKEDLVYCLERVVETGGSDKSLFIPLLRKLIFYHSSENLSSAVYYMVIVLKSPLCEPHDVTNFLPAVMEFYLQKAEEMASHLDKNTGKVVNDVASEYKEVIETLKWTFVFLNNFLDSKDTTDAEAYLNYMNESINIEEARRITLRLSMHVAEN